jgi:hypothetical protein
LSLTSFYNYAKPIPERKSSAFRNHFDGVQDGRIDSNAAIPALFSVSRAGIVLTPAGPITSISALRQCDSANLNLTSVQLIDPGDADPFAASLDRLIPARHHGHILHDISQAGWRRAALEEADHSLNQAIINACEVHLE